MSTTGRSSLADVPQSNAAARLDWVDYAKGICIIMVVMMHSTLGVEAAAGQTGYMHALVEFAKPFRMPDFFLISGLFLAVVIDRDWRTYLDRKVVHFAYFYLLWLTIQFAFKAPGLAQAQGWEHVGRLFLLSLIEPFGTLWFIYLLPVFFVVTKLTRRVPAAAILALAAALEMAQIQTGWTVIDEFAARFVYFYAGYLFARHIFAFAAMVQANISASLLMLAAWALGNGALVYVGVAHWPLISLVLGFAGAGAIIATGAVLARLRWLDGLRFCGANSLVIYLAFFLPMAISRTLLLKTGLDIGSIALLVTASGVLGALAMWVATRGTVLKFLFDRPAAFWLTARPTPALQAAE